MSEINLEWNPDGHQLKFVIDGEHLLVSMANCPNKRQKGTECWNEQAEGCIVDWFITQYELSCNHGTATVNGLMDIAWSIQGDTRDLASCQVWFLPIEDEAFASWFVERTSTDK